MAPALKQMADPRPPIRWQQPRCGASGGKQREINEIDPAPPITSTLSFHFTPRLLSSRSGLSHSRYFLQLQSFFDRTVDFHLLFHRSKLITHFCLTCAPRIFIHSLSTPAQGILLGRSHQQAHLRNQQLREKHHASLHPFTLALANCVGPSPSRRWPYTPSPPSVWRLQWSPCALSDLQRAIRVGQHYDWSRKYRLCHCC